MQIFHLKIGPPFPLIHSKKESCYFNKIFVELAACQSNKIFCYYDNKIC